MFRSPFLFSICGLAGACAIIGDDGDGGGGKADGFGEDSCDLPQYGDGTCQTDLACAAPDIDCFVLFESDAEAGTWFMRFEETLAAEEFRAPRAQIPESDPRFQRMRALLDRGWEAYQGVNPVAALADERPGLVVLEDPTKNAFVAPDLDSGNAGFAVMVLTGLLDLEADDASMLGLVMHELEHAVALHIVGDVKNRIRRFYVADDGEPFGFEKLDDPVAREHGEAWRALAGEVGAFPSEELGGLPFGGGELGQIFETVVVSRAQEPACADPIAALDQLRADLSGQVSPIDAGLHLVEPMRQRVDSVMASLRDTCLPGIAQGFIDVVAAMGNVTPEEIRANMRAEDIALVEGKHFIDGMAALVIDRRTRMRATEAAFADAAGYPWTALRYYSYEEAADDATIPVLHAMDLPPAGLAAFFIQMFDPEPREVCRGMVDAGQTPPYGADLSDEHHATCWRAGHNTQLAASGRLFDDDSDDPGQYRELAPAAPPRSRLLPPRLSDRLAY